MHPENTGLVTAPLRVQRRTAHHLSPVGREPLYVLGMLTGMRERMVQLGICDTSRVMRGGESEKRSFAAGEFEQCGAHPQIVSNRAPGGALRRKPAAMMHRIF